MSPKRIRLSRAKGWRKPDGAVVVARPTRWGNPITFNGPLDFFHIISFAGPRGERPYKAWRRDACASAYRFVMTAERRLVSPEEAAERTPFDAALTIKVGVLPTREEIIEALAGRDLACWCPLDACCHADVLLDLANQPQEPAP